MRPCLMLAPTEIYVHERSTYNTHSRRAKQCHKQESITHFIKATTFNPSSRMPILIVVHPTM